MIEAFSTIQTAGGVSSRDVNFKPFTGFTFTSPTRGYMYTTDFIDSSLALPKGNYLVAMTSTFAIATIDDSPIPPGVRATCSVVLKPDGGGSDDYLSVVDISTATSNGTPHAYVGPVLVTSPGALCWSVDFAVDSALVIPNLQVRQSYSTSILLLG